MMWAANYLTDTELLLKAAAEHVRKGDARSADPKVPSVVVSADTLLSMLQELERLREIADAYMRE